MPSNHSFCVVYSTPIDLSKGVYLVRIQSENHTGIQRLIVD